MEPVSTFISKLQNKIATPDQFFGYLFMCRDTAHLAHLKTTSYAQHVALGDYYDGLLDLIDSLVECYQGLNGIQNIIVPTAKHEDPISHIKASYKYIDQNRSIFKESFLQNIIDEIQQLNAQTLYKLTNLK